MPMFLRFLLWVLRTFCGRSIILGQKVAYEAWSPKEGMAYYYPNIYGLLPTIRSSTSVSMVSSATFSAREADDYKKRGYLFCFSRKEHAEVAKERIRRVLKDYHEELGY